MKELDEMAQGIADIAKELMRDSIHLANSRVGDDYNGYTAYVMELEG